MLSIAVWLILKKTSLFFNILFYISYFTECGMPALGVYHHTDSIALQTL